MSRQVAIIGAGPSGLMAAERLAGAGHAVTIYERMPSPARKLLVAGRGGLNLTHSEDFERFVPRYGAMAQVLRGWLEAFPPGALIEWAHGLGIETFTGTSGRVFPRAMKASPLLRAWLKRLDGLGVSLKTRHEWTGFGAGGALRFLASGTEALVAADAVILALGGASWPRLGSTGAWADILRREGIAVVPMAPANCGVAVAWSEPMRRFAGVPLKRIALGLAEASVRGEAVITATGLEGGAVYALSAAVRDALMRGAPVSLTIDHRPDMTAQTIARRLSSPRGKQSTATFLRKTLALRPAQIVLVREAGPLPAAAKDLARRIKANRLEVSGLAGLERAISTAGGVSFDAVDSNLMLKARPGVFVAGEMLDWEAPTGGYLLQACFASGVAAAEGTTRWLADPTMAPAPPASQQN